MQRGRAATGALGEAARESLASVTPDERTLAADPAEHGAPTHRASAPGLSSSPPTSVYPPRGRLSDGQRQPITVLWSTGSQWAVCLAEPVRTKTRKGRERRVGLSDCCWSEGRPDAGKGIGGLPGGCASAEPGGLNVPTAQTRRARPNGHAQSSGGGALWGSPPLLAPVSSPRGRRAADGVGGSLPGTAARLCPNWELYIHSLSS